MVKIIKKKLKKRKNSTPPPPLDKIASFPLPHQTDPAITTNLSVPKNRPGWRGTVGVTCLPQECSDQAQLQFEPALVNLESIGMVYLHVGHCTLKLLNK